MPHRLACKSGLAQETCRTAWHVSPLASDSALAPPPSPPRLSPLTRPPTAPPSPLTSQPTSSPLHPPSLRDARSASINDPNNLDPNYLSTHTARLSPWHSVLHAFRALGCGGGDGAGVGSASGVAVTATAAAPALVHIDVHGKMDRANNLECAAHYPLLTRPPSTPTRARAQLPSPLPSLPSPPLPSPRSLDVGLGPMEEEWDAEDATKRARGVAEVAAETIKSALGPAMEAAFEGRALVSRKSKKRLPLTVELDPLLSGYWGHHSDSPLTISHQSVLLGVPAFQLEIPYSMRELLMSDASAFDAFARALFGAIDATLAASGSGALGPCNALTDAPLEQASAGPSVRPLCSLSLLDAVDDAWLGAMVADLQRMDSESVHGKQI